MVKVKIKNVKREELEIEQRFTGYPFVIKSGNQTIEGVVKFDLENKKILVKVLEIKMKKDLKSLTGTNTVKYSQYSLSNQERLALMKEIFYIFACKYNRTIFGVNNREIPMYIFEETNNAGEACTLLEELLKYGEVDFDQRKRKEKVIANLVTSIKIFQRADLENIQSGETLELQFIPYLNSNNRLYYLKIFNDYAYKYKKDIRVDIENCRRIGKRIVYCYKLKKYTVTPLFPSKEIEEDALSKIR